MMFTALTSSATDPIASANINNNIKNNNISKNKCHSLINLENENTNLINAITSLNNANNTTNTISITNNNKTQLKVPYSVSQSTLNGNSHTGNSCILMHQKINLLKKLVLAACNNFNSNQQVNFADEMDSQMTCISSTQNINNKSNNITNNNHQILLDSFVMRPNVVKSDPFYTNDYITSINENEEEIEIYDEEDEDLLVAEEEEEEEEYYEELVVDLVRTKNHRNNSLKRQQPQRQHRPHQLTTHNLSRKNLLFSKQQKNINESSLSSSLLSSKQLINKLDFNRYSIHSNNIKQIISHQTQQQPQKNCVNNCLAVDCNLASLSCCLSSSSSTSSLSSSSSSSTVAKPFPPPSHSARAPLPPPSTLTFDSSLTSNNKNLINTQLINKKLQLISNTNKSCSKRNPSKSSSSIGSFLTNSKKHLSSSNDCLSSDEGYFGSFSDTSLATSKLKSNDLISAASFEKDQQQHQLMLLQFLLHQQNQSQSTKNIDTTSTISSAETVSLTDIVNASQKEINDTHSIFPLNLFSGKEDDSFSMSSFFLDSPIQSLIEPTNNDLFDFFSKPSQSSYSFQPKQHQYTNQSTEETSPVCFKCFTSNTSINNESDLIYLSMIWSDLNSCNLCLSPSFFCSSTHNLHQNQKQRRNPESLSSLLSQLQTERMERAQADELEMRSQNWRRLLEHRTQADRLRQELITEDLIDCSAYLNEIEMNLDYFQSIQAAETTNNSNTNCLGVYVDDGHLLKFRTNRMAFNLRQYHAEIELQLQLRKQQQQQQQQQLLINMAVRQQQQNQNQQLISKSNHNTFANVHVDSIPEFVPVNSQTNSMDFTDEPNSVHLLCEENDETYEMNEDGKLESDERGDNDYDELIYDGDEFHNADFVGDHYDETTLGVDKDENDYTLIESKVTHYHQEHHLRASKNLNQALGNEISASSSATTTFSEQAVEQQQPIDDTEYEYYYENEEDYELYEDQLLIDGLTEQEAITLLRNESELYALQMAQASKSGILIHSNATTSSSATVSNKNKNKDRFNSGDSTTNTSATLNNNNINNKNISVSEDIFENVFNYDELILNAIEDSPSETTGIVVADDLIDTELFFYNENINSSTGQISMSLRNSLLKLRHTRRHLARMLEQESQKSTNASSTASSSPAASSHLVKSMSSRKPCVYMLNEGRCMRADCRFAHDLKTITCKYWLDGECLKGENCEFLHDHMPEEHTASQSHKSSFSNSYKNKNKDKGSALPIAKPIDFKLDTEEFPALGGGNSSSGVKSTISSSAASNLLKTTVGVKDENKQVLSNILNKQPPLKTAASVLLAKISSNNTSQSSSSSSKTPAVNITTSKAFSTTNGSVSSKKKKNNSSSTISLSSSASSSCSSLNMNKTTIVNSNKIQNSSKTSVSTATTTNQNAMKNSSTIRKSRDLKTKSDVSNASTKIADNKMNAISGNSRNSTNSCNIGINSRGNSTIRKK